MPTLTDSELLQELNNLKKSGNEFFKQAKFQEAYDTYQQAISLNKESCPHEYENYQNSLTEERTNLHNLEQELEAPGLTEEDKAKISERKLKLMEPKQISEKFNLLSILHQNSAACVQKIDSISNKTAIQNCEIALDYNPMYVKNIRRLAELYYIEGTSEEISTSRRKSESDTENNSKNSDDEDDESYPNPFGQFDSPKYNFQNKAVEMYTALQKLDHLTGKESKQMQELQEQLNSRQAEMQAAMMSQLKNLGNMCLKPFGLSTDNFSMQDNGSGGYSMSFNK